MGKAYYCDRCGRLQNESELESKEVIISGVFNEDLKVIMDVGCARDIEDFVYGNDLKKKKKQSKN